MLCDKNPSVDLSRSVYPKELASQLMVQPPSLPDERLDCMTLQGLLLDLIASVGGKDNELSYQLSWSQWPC
jgi:hypothetical protein